MLHRISLLPLLFLFFAFQSLGQGHEDVFPDKSGNELLNLLRANYKPATVLDYYHARLKIYTEIYNENDSVYGVYTNYALHLSPDDPDPIGTLIRNGSDFGINTEHTFPQSKGARQGNARSDMHHLFPAMARVNSARSNYPFGDIDDKQTRIWYYKDKALHSIPSTHKDDYSESIDGRFEPREAKKGDIARAMFYFMTMYRSQADAKFFSGQRTTLCEWHMQDPVDEGEWKRNDMKAQYQEGKKNPFILDCTLAMRTFCPEFEYDCKVASKDIFEDQTQITLIPSPDAKQVMVHVSAPVPAGIDLLVYDALARPSAMFKDQQLNREWDIPLHVSSGGVQLFLIRLTDKQGYIRHTFVKKFYPNR